MSLENEIIQTFMEGYSTVGNNPGFTGITLGVVVDSDDPLQMGRLRIFCPSLNDDPKSVQYVPWAIYASPFSGSVNNDKYTRGVGGDQTAETKGALHYGFWAIPELGAHVLVGCVDGDFRRRFWMACVPQHQETNTLHHGRWKWDDGKIEGPLSSSDQPMQPLYDNLSEAFQNKKDSPEWKTRAADYQASAIREDAGQIPNPKKRTYTDQTNKSMVDSEDDEWIKDAIGAHGYDWSGYKNYGAFLAPRTYGMSSPGMHAIVMDDRPFNNRIRMRTTTGHQIILDDTNERIYISTNKGKSWLEMDSNGRIDVFSDGGISFGTTGDMNFTAQGTIRLHASESIHMYAGHNLGEDGTTGDELLEHPPVKGEIRIQAATDYHAIAQNIRYMAEENIYNEAKINRYDMVGDSAFFSANRDISITTVEGDHITTSGRSIFTTSTQETKCFSDGRVSVGAVNNVEMSSFSGQATVSASQNVQVKSMNSNVEVEAGSVSGSGQISHTTPNSQQTISDQGISTITSGTVSSESAQNELVVAPGGHAPGDPPIDAASSNKVVVAPDNINLEAKLGTIVNRTILNSQTYDVLSDKVDELVVNLDVLTKQVSLISSAIDAAVSGFSPPVSFDLPCLDSSMFGSLPSSLLDLFPSFAALQTALDNLGYTVSQIEDLAALLNGNSALLALLGLPTNLTLPSFDSSCTSIMDVFNGIISIDGAEDIVPEPLREMLDGIFNNNADYGPPQPKPDYPAPTPCPLTPAPPTPEQI